jgi:two-component system sensor kinase FixL
VESEYGALLADYLRLALVEGVVVVDAEGQVRFADEADGPLLGDEPGDVSSVSLANYGVAQGARGVVHPAEADGRPHEAAYTPSDPTTAGGLNQPLVYVQRLAGVGLLTDSVAHELTNPLSIITAACTNLKDELADGVLTADQMGRYAEMIEQSAFRCARILEVLQRYTHDEGLSGPNMAITSPSEIVQDALALVEQQFRKRAQVEIVTDLPPGLQAIVCDHNRITQALVNLLLHARDAMQPDGGTITIRFWPLGTLLSVHSAARPANGETHGHEERDYFAFSVSDTGPGIDPAALERLFDPFSGAPGAGLGLFIARGIIAEHGGRLSAENDPRGGTTFTAILPKRQ